MDNYQFSVTANYVEQSRLSDSASQLPLWAQKQALVISQLDANSTLKFFI